MSGYLSVVSVVGGLFSGLIAFYAISGLVVRRRSAANKRAAEMKEIIDDWERRRRRRLYSYYESDGGILPNDGADLKRFGRSEIGSNWSDIKTNTVPVWKSPPPENQSETYKSDDEKIRGVPFVVVWLILIFGSVSITTAAIAAIWRFISGLIY